ncbi:hypothetical protein Zmor_027269 [Zophobas morio]|uniref:Uncharacterized protein n=1 Tax=Zophobas morio TaxID=2755281 RepID=A0AA38HN10_9CUCU|nr:hypothetical protein Zmor_027269 [Zophobas morio]
MLNINLSELNSLHVMTKPQFNRLAQFHERPASFHSVMLRRGCIRPPWRFFDVEKLVPFLWIYFRILGIERSHRRQ